MSLGKAIFAAVLLVAALIGGMFLASWLVITLLHVQVPLAWNVWWQYFQVIDDPHFAPFAQKIKISAAVGGGVPLLAWLCLLIPLFKSKQESLHGDASFGDIGDAKKAGLLKRTSQGLLIGRLKGRYLWLSGALHLIMIAATRTGKTTSVAIPVLLTYEESVVVSDFKGELRKLTSGQRRAMGQHIYVWAPYDVESRTHRFNPLSLLANSDARVRIGEIQTIASILYPDEPGKDPFWTSQSRASFTAFASFMFERWDHNLKDSQARQLPRDFWPDPNVSEAFPSLERILRISSGEGGTSTKEMLAAIVKNSNGQYAYVSYQTRAVFSNLSGLADQTFSSVLATMQAPLQQFLSPILAAATNATDFDITSIRKRPTTIYVDIPTNKLDESGKLLNIFYSSVIGNNLGKQLGEEPDLKYQMLTLMDEFTAMGRLDVWAKRISISASYGVRSLVIVQSRAQLRGTYGDNDAQNLITNHGCQLALTPREQSDANDISEMMGYKTVRRRHESRSRGNGSNQTSISYSEEKRPLMLPQEVKELPQDDELIFKEGCKVIRAKKNWFFKDKLLKKLSQLPPVVIEPLAKRLAAKQNGKPKRVFVFN